MMHYGLDIHKNRISVEDADRASGYFCEGCGAPLTIKRGEMRAHHFAHTPGTGYAEECWLSRLGESNDMTEWHYDWLLRFPVETRERVFPDMRHRADVCMGKDVIEFQHGKLEAEDFFERNAFYRSAGLRVSWVLDVISDAAEGRLERFLGMDTQYHWKNPMAALPAGALPEDVTLYLQPEEDRIIKVTDMSAHGLSLFEAGESFDRAGFLGEFGLDGASEDHPGEPAEEAFAESAERISFMDPEGHECILGCPLAESGIRRAQECDACSYQLLERSGAGKRLCSRPEGAAAAAFAKDLLTLWHEYGGFRTAVCYNVRLQNSVQITGSIREMISSTGKLVGRAVGCGGSAPEKKCEIYGWSEPVWIITWFKR